MTLLLVVGEEPCDGPGTLVEADEMALKTRVGTTSGAWAADASWTPAETPAAVDDAVVNGPAGPAIQTLIGPGSAAAPTLTGKAFLLAP